MLHTSPKRHTRRRVAALVALVLVLPMPAMAWGNDPQVRLLFPRDGGSLRSDRVPLVMARFDRSLRPPSEISVLDRFGAAVNGISRLNEPDDEPESWRAIEFLPTSPLPEAGSPFAATARVCGVSQDCRLIDWTFRIDDTAPSAPTVSSPASNAFVTDQVVTVRGVTEPGATVSVFEVPDLQQAIGQGLADEAGRYVVELPYPPEDGASHTIRVSSQDEAGNVSPLSGSRTFRHDAIALGPIITAPRDGQELASGSVLVEGRAKANTTIRIREGGPIVATTTSGADDRFSVSVSFASGPHTITAESFDGVLTDGPSPAVTFEIDLVAPAAPIILLPAAGSSAPGPDVLIQGTGEARATLRLREAGVIRAEVPISISGDWSLSLPFADGARSLTAEVVDAAGNVSPAAAVSFLVDSVEPVAAIITAPSDGSFVATSLVTVGGNAEANSTVVIERNATILGTTTANPSGVFSFGIVFADGTYMMRARAIDAAGNRGALGPAVSFGVDTLAPAAPAITRPYDMDIVATAPIAVSGTAEPNSGVRLLEGVTVLASVIVTTTGVWSTQITVPAGVHALKAIAVDRAGNMSTDSPIVTVTYDPGAPDITPPGAPTILSPSSGSFTSAYVVFRGLTEPFATVEVREGFSMLVTATADGSGVWESGLMLVNGPHTITARARDRAGNLGVASGPVSFTVDGHRPTLEVTSIDPAIVLPFEPVIVNGTANDNFSVSRIEVEAVDRLTAARFGPFVGSCPACPAGTVSWDATIALPPGLYRIEAFAVDHVGNRSIADEATILRL